MWGGVEPAAAATAPPVTIPAVQSWTPAPGSYRFTPVSRIVVDPSYLGRLSTLASVFAEDLRSLVGRAPAVRAGNRSQVRSGDLFLTLAPGDTSLGADGYRLGVGSSVTATGRTDAGDFYGTPAHSCGGCTAAGRFRQASRRTARGTRSAG
jgi:hexosaminidase